MATIIKQWNGLPGRAGESLFVCYAWPGLLLGLMPPRFCGGNPPEDWPFFRLQDSANLAQDIPICSCSPLEIQPDPCKIAGGWRVVRRKRKEAVCLFQWKK